MNAAFRDSRLVAGGIGVVLFILYFLTLAPSMNFIDAGELSAVAHTFGIAHPTGYPFFTMLSGLWAQLPLGSGIYRLNLLAALLCAGAAAVFFLAIRELLALPSEAKLSADKTKGAKKPSGKQSGAKAKSGRIESLPENLILVAAAFGAFIVGLSETYWSTALSIEVYSLHIMMLAVAVYLFIRAVLNDAPEKPVERYWWPLFCLALGLSFTNHMTTILLIPAFAVVLIRRYRFGASLFGKLGKGLPFFFVGLLPYLYLPLRAASGPALNWGNPASWERFLWHISGKQYRVWIFSSTEATKKQLDYFLSGFPAEFGYLLLLLILPGIFFAFKRNRSVGWLLLLLFVTCVAYSINYDIHDIDSYFLLAYIVCGVWAAYGLLFIAQLIPYDRIKAALGVAALSLGILGGLNWGMVSEQGNYLVEDYTRNVFNSLKPNALVFSFQWDYWVSASYYYQHVEKLRPDVVVIDKELLRRSWYFEQLRRNHPEIYRRSEAQIQAFLRELDKFEHERPYDPNVIEARFNGMINHMIEANMQDRPVYLGVEMERQFAADYLRIPEGMAFRLYPQSSPPSPDAKVWDDFTYRPLDRSGRLIEGVKGMYAAMLSARARFLAEGGKLEDAARYIDRAMEFTPNDMTLLDLKRKISEMKATLERQG